MMATPQTIPTCHNPCSAPVRAATWTAPQPKKTSMNVPITSAKQRAGNLGVDIPIQRLAPGGDSRSLAETQAVIISLADGRCNFVDVAVAAEQDGMVQHQRVVMKPFCFDQSPRLAEPPYRPAQVQRTKPLIES